MTPPADVVGDVLGLEGTFPRPGWVVLDAIRDQRFTGEVVFALSPEVRVYADRGRIYLAERSSDPSLGARLVDAGALNAVQLAHGTMRLGDAEHLGRLFERVPSVDRHQVLVAAELMTEECVGWIAAQKVSGAEATPYRHHPSGVHRWERGPDSELAPGDPLPAPAPDAAPVDIGPPEPLFTPSDLADTDDMIRWNEPSWLDEQLVRIDVAGLLAELRAGDDDDADVIEPIKLDVATDAARGKSADDQPRPDAPGADSGHEAAPDEPASHDWIDTLHATGLPEPGSDPLASPVRLAPLPAEPSDRFELIWPSGDIDEQFGAQLDEPLPHPDIDRAGPTARLVRQGARRASEPCAEPTVVIPSEPVADEEIERWLADETGRDTITDEVVLAVRRAVASIETGSLASRRRLADASNSEVTLPGRVAVRGDAAESVVPSVRNGAVNGSSVFDKLPAVDPLLNSDGQRPAGPPDGAKDEAPRASALRRLIGSIRRR